LLGLVFFVVGAWGVKGISTVYLGIYQNRRWADWDLQT
jgi:hypothetical protein